MDDIENRTPEYRMERLNEINMRDVHTGMHALHIESDKVKHMQLR